MRKANNSKKIILFFPFLIMALNPRPLLSQDLDPRAYARLPINATILISGFNYSQGGILTDPTLPLTDLEAKVEMLSLGVAHTFSLFGQTAQAFAVLPFGWGQASALIGGQSESTDRTGFADMRIRLSVLLLGGKAERLNEFGKNQKRTILGTSLTVVAPTGQYFSDKLINLGTSRWSFKPEIAFSQRLGKRWMFDAYYGVWFFTTNNSFYPGSSARRQDPLHALQSHISYNITPRAWVAFDATYYTGGQSTINDVLSDDRQENSRIGATLSLPIGKKNSLKVAVSKGAIIRIGADFTSVSLGWTAVWFKKPDIKQKVSE
ncbi:MAG: transporter [Bacteroidales bacterium]